MIQVFDLVTYIAQNANNAFSPTTVLAGVAGRVPVVLFYSVLAPTGNADLLVGGTAVVVGTTSLQEAVCYFVGKPGDAVTVSLVGATADKDLTITAGYMHPIGQGASGNLVVAS